MSQIKFGILCLSTKTFYFPMACLLGNTVLFHPVNQARTRQSSSTSPSLSCPLPVNCQILLFLAISILFFPCLPPLPSFKLASSLLPTLLKKPSHWCLDLHPSGLCSTLSQTGLSISSLLAKSVSRSPLSLE